MPISVSACQVVGLKAQTFSQPFLPRYTCRRLWQRHSGSSTHSEAASKRSQAPNIRGLRVHCRCPCRGHEFRLPSPRIRGLDLSKIFSLATCCLAKLLQAFFRSSLDTGILPLKPHENTRLTISGDYLHFSLHHQNKPVQRLPHIIDIKLPSIISISHRLSRPSANWLKCCSGIIGYCSLLLVLALLSVHSRRKSCIMAQSSPVVSPR